MRKSLRVPIRARHAASLVTALSLILHIGLMAFGTAPRPTIIRNAAAQNLHHADDAKLSHSSDPKKTEKHPQVCCILSYLQGLPPPDGGWFLPHPISAILTFKESSAPALIQFSLPYPVGARAPPILA
ncbi:hypothetical protein [Microvirga sp. VF16]|uniref:hypothetical protein n=1 Tax=Microvirga sp. VF16 TaxID=2807101 RepID=UPI00193C953D|nr:hypothetical protein [Microvirga sp. VF16]QRM27671.1 hypothetical protein JO965_15470 [Microvirga sp. VF16]